MFYNNLITDWITCFFLWIQGSRIITTGELTGELAGELPSWIPELAQSCKFLFPMETRKLLFYITAFDRERALQQLAVFSPDSVGARIAHITCRLLRKQITENHELFLEEAKIAFDRMSKNDKNAILEVKLKNKVSIDFLLNCHDYLIDFLNFTGRTWGGVVPTRGMVLRAGF